MKKLLVLISASLLILGSCRGHGPLCPAYSSVNKKIQNLTTDNSVDNKKVKPS